MNTIIPFNSRVCFTGAPGSGLEELVLGLHGAIQAATGGRIPFFDLSCWVHPESKVLSDNHSHALDTCAVVDTLVGANGPRGEEQHFFLLRGPVDILALAVMQGVTLPPETSHVCGRLLHRVHLVVLQMPDPERWRARGFGDHMSKWLLEYTRAVLEILRNHDLRLEQLRVLPPHRGDPAGNVVEASWRLFGSAPNPLNPAERTEPMTSFGRTAEAQAREVFERSAGSLFGTPHIG